MDFAFNASALGVGGVIERGNVITTIPSLASVALAPTGGEGRSVVSNYFSEELEFSHAETRVFGRKVVGADGKPEFTTYTYVLIKDVRIFDKIRIAEMSSTVTSTRGLEDGDDHAFELVLSYRGVRVNGREIGPKVDLRLCQLKRYDELNQILTAQRKPSAEVQALARRFNATPEQLAQLVREKKPVQGSVVESLEGVGQRPSPSTIFVRGLGTVRFGELMIKPGRRRLNLLRINFGDPPPQHEGAMPHALMTDAMDDPIEEAISTKPTGGSITMGSGEGNGTPIGP